MAVAFDLLVQAMQMFLVLLLAPLLTGLVRKVKARLLLRRGPSVIQPYRDLIRLLRKEVTLARNASWLFRATPYLIFAVTWVAAALVPHLRPRPAVQLVRRSHRLLPPCSAAAASSWRWRADVARASGHRLEPRR